MIHILVSLIGAMLVYAFCEKYSKTPGWKAFIVFMIGYWAAHFLMPC